METQRFGLEIEFTGITRATAARAVADALNSTERYEGGNYSTYEIRTADNRKWKVMSDASISAENRTGGYAGNDYKCEFVTPICTYEDIERIQEIVRALRGVGAKVNSSCGIHIHIDANTHTAKSLKNLANIMASKETLLFKALEVEDTRATQWCKKIEGKLLDKLTTKRPKTMEEVKQI